MIISVKLLDGSKLCVSIESTQYNLIRVKDVRDALVLQSGHANLSTAILFANGEQLDDQQLIGSRGQAGSFLVAVPDSSEAKRQKTLPITDACPKLPQVQESILASSRLLAEDTLLPGYHLRPGPSPIKRQEKARKPENVTQAMTQATGKAHGKATGKVEAIE